MAKTQITINVRRGDTVIDVPCGTIEPTEPFFTLCDTGFRKEWKYEAISSYRDDRFIFMTANAAIYWLKLIAEAVEQRDARLAILEDAEA